MTTHEDMTEEATTAVTIAEATLAFAERVWRDARRTSDSLCALDLVVYAERELAARRETLRKAKLREERALKERSDRKRDAQAGPSTSDDAAAILDR